MTFINSINGKQWSEIQEIISKILEEEGFELVDLQFKRAKGRHLLKIFIDHDRGINIDDCENISNRVSEFIDSYDFIPGPYVLEVSSPGLDRPLKSERDYIRNIGYRVKIIFKTENHKKETIIGRIDSFKDKILILEDGNNRVHTIAFASILEGKLIIDF